MEIEDFLQRLECENIEITKSRFLDDSKFYMESITTLLQDSNWNLLGELLESKKAEEAFDVAHMLKGVIANFGLTHAYDTIAKIVEILRKKDIENVELPILYEKLIQYKKQIENLMK